MEPRENSATFAVVDETGRHHIVKEFVIRAVDDKGKVIEYEFAVNRLPISRVNDDEFIVPESNLRLYRQF